jgi:sugar phosphate isomerase/epimerase
MEKTMRYSRRDFGRIALAGLPAAGFLLEPEMAFAGLRQGKPNSKWAGVQVGMNVPYNFKAGNYMTADDIIARCQQLGVSGMELRAQPVELFLGSPTAVAAAAAGGNRGRGAGGRGGGRQGAGDTQPSAAGGEAGTAPPAARGERGGRRGGGRAELTPEQQAAQRAAAEETRKWRAAVSLDKVKEFRRKFDDAGIGLQVIKWDGIYGMSDDEVDYCFQVSKALGAAALSTEISIEDTKRVGQFADKHKMPIGYHGHATTSAADFETVLSYAKYNAVNLDLGHFTAGQNQSPVPFLKKHHARITHVHVKDRKLDNGPNVPLGQGDTPIKEVLQLMRANKWPIQAILEFEYPVPEGSDLNTELARCMQYCKECLIG